MAMQFKLSATSRNDLGKGASRRLRREGKVPVILYGAGEEPTSATMMHKDLWRAQEEEAFYASILTVELDGKAMPALVKDMQRHPAKELVLHADFLRIDPKKKIHVHVPLHFINEEACHGVKMQGGMISHAATDIEVNCLPGALPEYIEVDMTDVELGQIVHISDVKLPEGVESVALTHGEDHDHPVVQVLAPKGGAQEEEAGDSEETSEE